MNMNTARGSTPNKRKDREFLKPSRFVKPSSHGAAVKTTQTTSNTEPASKNQLLAGYLAYEFLNKGTLFGQAWDPARAAEEPRRLKEKSREGEPSEAQPVERNERYVGIADLLKGDGVHLPGIVNPTQLAGFLQL